MNEVLGVVIVILGLGFLVYLGGTTMLDMEAKQPTEIRIINACDDSCYDSINRNGERACFAHCIETLGVDYNGENTS